MKDKSKGITQYVLWRDFFLNHYNYVKSLCNIFSLADD